jgi:hypothetical protein
MSEIDSHKHTLLGFIDCPSSLTLVPGNESCKVIAMYALEEDVSEGTESFHGQAGDIIVGGGRGEAPALRISMPEALIALGVTKGPSLAGGRAPWIAFWSMNDAYAFCDGYRNCGWDPALSIERWVSGAAIGFLMGEYPELFQNPAAIIPPIPPGLNIRRERGV